jgi:gluconolactonase
VPSSTINVLATGLRFPEGPVFAPDGVLWCVELKGGGLVRWRQGALTRVATGGAPNGAAVDRAGRIWFCDSGHNSIRRLDPRTGEIVSVVERLDGQPFFKPNDLAFDAAGNLVFSCPGDSRQVPTGYVCCLAPDGAVSMIAREKYFPNGFAFTADGRSLLLAETYRQRIWLGDWDTSRREWSNAHIWAEGVTGAPGPDGMAFGADGRLYVAVYGSGQIKIFNADGKQIGARELPGKNPTNCAFDPAGKLGLVVTEAERGELLSLPDLGPGAPLFVPDIPEERRP